MTSERAAEPRETLARVLESIVVRWDAGDIDNYGAADLVLAVIEKAGGSAARSSAVAEEIAVIVGPPSTGTHSCWATAKLANVRAALAGAVAPQPELDSPSPDARDVEGVALRRWLDGAIDHADGFGSDSVTVKVHMLRLVAAALRGVPA